MLLTAREAADRLGVKLDTLYAYVSRGRLRSVTVQGTRERRYRTEDVEALLNAGPRDRLAARGSDPEVLMPVITSSICLIEDGRLYYRGRDAIGLSDRASLEEIAALLWRVEVVAHNPIEVGAPAPPDVATAGGLIERCQIRLAALGDEDLPALDLTRTGVIRTGWQILHALARCVTPALPSPEPLHQQLATAWRLDEAGADILRRCLVLLADHELNASTFVARCVASTGATPYAVVAAALGALSGRRHGGATASAEALFQELARRSDPMSVMASRLSRGEGLPGFGQFLYPEGDPRAASLLGALERAAPQAYPLIATVTEAGTRLTGQHPNVDFAVAAATAALGLPQHTALGLFVIGRTVGWIAHAIEQYETGVLIRPRARYTGERPPIA